MYEKMTDQELEKESVSIKSEMQALHEKRLGIFKELKSRAQTEKFTKTFKGATDEEKRAVIAKLQSEIKEK